MVFFTWLLCFLRFVGSVLVYILFFRVRVVLFSCLNPIDSHLACHLCVLRDGRVLVGL